MAQELAFSDAAAGGWAAGGRAAPPESRQAGRDSSEKKISAAIRRGASGGGPQHLLMALSMSLGARRAAMVAKSLEGLAEYLRDVSSASKYPDEEEAEEEAREALRPLARAVAREALEALRVHQGDEKVATLALEVLSELLRTVGSELKEREAAEVARAVVAAQRAHSQTGEVEVHALTALWSALELCGAGTSALRAAKREEAVEEAVRGGAGALAVQALRGAATFRPSEADFDIDGLCFSAFKVLQILAPAMAEAPRHRKVLEEGVKAVLLAGESRRAEYEDVASVGAMLEAGGYEPPSKYDELDGDVPLGLASQQCAVLLDMCGLVESTRGAAIALGAPEAALRLLRRAVEIAAEFDENDFASESDDSEFEADPLMVGLHVAGPGRHGPAGASGHRWPRRGGGGGGGRRRRGGHGGAQGAPDQERRGGVLRRGHPRWVCAVGGWGAADGGGEERRSLARGYPEPLMALGAHVEQRGARGGARAEGQGGGAPAGGPRWRGGRDRGGGRAWRREEAGQGAAEEEGARRGGSDEAAARTGCLVGGPGGLCRQLS